MKVNAFHFLQTHAEVLWDQHFGVKMQDSQSEQQKTIDVQSRTPEACIPALDSNEDTQMQSRIHEAYISDSEEDSEMTTTVSVLIML